MAIGIRTGLGIDVHRFAEGRQLWLCGILIPDASRGLDGHSDADVALHALCDAMLGAAGMRDIGYYFPDTDPSLKGIDSKVLLTKVTQLIAEAGWQCSNIDITICAQTPKLAPYIDLMRQCIASLTDTELSAVAVKATTTEHLGFTGRKEGIAAFANVLLASKQFQQ